VGDTPAHLSVKFWHEANREDNVMGSKAVGEPPFMLALSVLEALRDAVANARQPSSTATTPTAPQVVQLNAPATPERILWALHA
jgi:xanthine dehydrogenase large subunit